MKYNVRNAYERTNQVVDYDVYVSGTTLSANIPKVALSGLEIFGEVAYLVHILEEYLRY